MRETKDSANKECDRLREENEKLQRSFMERLKDKEKESKEEGRGRARGEWRREEQRRGGEGMKGGRRRRREGRGRSRGEKRVEGEGKEKRE